MTRELDKRYTDFKKTFTKQSDFLKSVGNVCRDKAVVSYNWRKFAYKSDWKELVELLQHAEQKQDNLYNEYICEDQPVKPYIDIEWYDHEFPLLSMEDDMYYATVILSDIKKSIRKLFKEYWDIELDPKSLRVKECHREQFNKGFKRSYHVVVSPEQVSYLFRDNKECVCFAMKLKEYTMYPEVIDISVYTSFRNLRLLGQCKEDERNHKFVPYGNQVLSVEQVLHYLVTFSLRQYCYLKTDEVEDPFIRPSNVPINVSDETLNFITEKVKQLHPTAFFERIDHNNFIQYNYTDRKEHCFFNKAFQHDRNGFYVLLSEEGDIKVGCHSPRCKDAQKKKTIYIGNINENVKSDEFLAVSLERSDSEYIPLDILRQYVENRNIGMSNIFCHLYLKDNKRIKWVNMDERSNRVYYWDGFIWKEDNFMFLHNLLTVKVVEQLVKASRSINGGDLDIGNEDEAMSNKDSQSQVGTLNSVPDKDKQLLKELSRMINSLKDGTVNANILKFVRCQANDLYFDKIKNIHPNRLSVANGMVDLKTKALKPAIPQDNITRTLELDYTMDYTDEYTEWDTFVRDITRSKTGEECPDHYNFLRWIFGYSMQGVPRHKKFFIFWGPEGYNGKSILLNTISDVLEDYCVTMDKTIVLESKQKTSGSHSTELVRLENCRIGILSDTKEDCCIDDGQIKQLTSITDKISVREIYGKQKEMKPTFVPIIATNYKIRVNLQDPSMYERLVLFPFWIRFLDNPTESHHRKNDRTLSEKFNNPEYKKAILAWLIDCSEFYHNNVDISTPKTLIQIKDEYRRSMNSYLEFIDLFYDRLPDSTNLSDKLDSWIRKAEVVEAFCAYCSEEGIKYTQRNVQKELDKILTPYKKGNIQMYIGIKRKGE